jgi:hypothetical protein
VKHYPSGSVIEVCTITKPVAGTVKIYVDGMEQLATSKNLGEMGLI